MMHMEQRLSQRQNLVLTQKMQQALHILQLSSIELDQYVQQELESNPFLEQVQTKDDGEATTATSEEVRPQSTSDGAAEQQDVAFDLDAYADKWDMARREGQDLSRNDDLAARRQYYEDSITQSESLRAHLLTQLRISTDDPSDFAIGERIIIGEMDSRGYFTGSIDEVAAELGHTPERVRDVLRIIKRMEPTGVGARDVIECLLLQAYSEYPKNRALHTLIREHFEALKRRQIPAIAKAMKISIDDVEQLKALVATLNPWPGHEYTSGPPQYIAPDVIVEKDDDGYIVRLSGDVNAALSVNSAYSQQIRAGNGISKDDRDYVRAKLESARWLTRNIAQRQQTILRVAQAIVEYRRDFLDKGIEHIRPLTLQVIADQLGVHESTVARTTRGKYMQTPQGLFELKYFFSPGLAHESGDAQSSKSVQAQVKKLIEGEDKRKPLSDQKIADLLKKEGTKIARRTVTKYREALGIPTTTMRREYQGK